MQRANPPTQATRRASASAPPRLEALEDRLTPTFFTTGFTPFFTPFNAIFPTSGLTFAVVSSGAQNFWTLQDPSHFANLNSVPALIVSIFDVAGLRAGANLPPVTIQPVGTVVTLPVTTIVTVPVSTVLTVPVSTVVTAPFGVGLTDDPAGISLDPQASSNPGNQQFVNALYQSLLGRPADAPGLALWAGMLGAGVSRFDVAMRIQSSTEFLQDEVAAAYQTILHRQVDPGGLSTWTNFLAAGHSPSELAAQLVGSAEFSQTQGASNNAFLAALYQDALGRTVDPQGQAVWGSALAAGESRAQVAAAVFRSPEYLRNLTNGFYRQLLNRDATAADLNAAVAALQSGLSQNQLIAGILSSTEFAGLLGS
jgi:hypothetical protein